jgi:uncharacterized RDD family membrane protein YckC
MPARANQTQEVIEDFLTEEPIRLASRRNRWCAALIDFGIWFIMVAIITYCLGDVTTDEEGTKHYDLGGAQGFFGMTIPWLILLPLLEAINHGQTIGKTIFKIRSAKKNGSSITTSAAFARHLLDIIDYLPFFGIAGLLVAGNSQYKQRLGDTLAGTIVVEA